MAQAVAKRAPPRKTFPDTMQRKMVDEYGELQRQVELFAPVEAKHGVLKRAIKGWFDTAPADAEATLEGKIYVLTITARERERRVRDMRALASAVGLDKLLEIVARYVPLGPVETIIGKEKLAALVTDERTGPRRIKAVPKRPSGPQKGMN